MSTDLSTLSSTELKKLIEAANGMIQSRQQEELRAAYTQFEQIAAGLGATVEQILEAGRHGSRKVKAPRKAIEPRYRNPENASETWTGRGKQPRWLAAAIGAGRKLEEFLISK